MRLSDDAFIHVSIAETEDGANPIPRLEAFRTFVLVKERCVEPPRPDEAIVVGNYRMVGEP